MENALQHDGQLQNPSGKTDMIVKPTLGCLVM